MLIQKYRLQRGWSQQQLADLSGLSVRTIQRLENGQAASTESLKSLAAVFDIAFTQLMPQTNTPDPFSPELPPSSAASATPHRSEEDLALKLAYRRMRRLRSFYLHLVPYCIVTPSLFALNLWHASGGPYWAFWPALGWGIGLLFHAARVFGWSSFLGADWEKRQVEKYLGRPL